jgi:hypothetical protein
MDTAFRNLERARQELIELHREFAQLERHIESLRESVRTSVTELFRTDRQAFPALDDATLATRIADAVISRLPVPARTSSVQKGYVREREAAEYMGVKVATLRAWRIRRSQSGPPFARVGRMILYPVAELQARMYRIRPRAFSL